MPLMIVMLSRWREGSGMKNIVLYWNKKRGSNKPWCVRYFQLGLCIVDGALWEIHTKQEYIFC
jgi:hypothetical protein